MNCKQITLELLWNYIEMIERFTKDLYVEFYGTEVLGDKKTPLVKKIVSEKLGGAQRSEVEERERGREWKVERMIRFLSDSNLIFIGIVYI